MGRRGRAAGGGMVRGKTGIVLEFAKPQPAGAVSSASTNVTGSSVGSVPVKKVEAQGRCESASPVFIEEAENHYEKCTSKSLDQVSAERVVRHWSNSSARRVSFHSENTNVNYEEFESLRQAKKLDSTLKRCNAFVKKLKNYSGQQVSIEQEIESLNLTKYLSEICAAISENQFKDSFHVWELISICSKLHQRYQEFSSTMLELYKTKFSVKLTEADWATMPADLRLLTELTICGILGDDGFPIILSCLKQLISSDKENSAHMTLMLAFVKEFGLEVAGILPKSVQILCDTFSIPVPLTSDLVHPQKRIKVKYLLKEYMQNVCSHLTKLHDKLNNSELVRRKLLKTRGEVPKEREDEHKEILTSFEKFHNQAKKLAFYADTDLPELQELPPDEEEEELSAGLESIELETVARSSFFDDEESRSFYQDLPDLSKYLTSAARRENVLILEQQAEALRMAEENLDEESEMAELESDAPVPAGEVDLEPEPDLPIASRSTEAASEDGKSAPKLLEYLKSLLQCVNRNMIDEAAEQFLRDFNNKPNRKKLSKHLTNIPRQRVDLLPLWSRYIAILNPVVPEVGAEVVEFLKKELRHLIRRCHPTFIETKLKVVRYIAELVKFEVFPPIDAFTCLRILLVNFTHHQLEMACAFVENCGRYLFKNPVTRRRMKLYIDQMMRKKQVKALSPRYTDLVEQAYVAVFPPEGGQKKKRVPVTECYLEILIYGILYPNTIKTIIKKLRKMKWNEPKVFNTAIKIFCRPWLMSATKFKAVADVLSQLSEYYPSLGVAVTDTLITLVLEALAFHDTLNNQHLVTMLNYMCELYCYQLYTADNILQLMYAFIIRGVSMDYSRPLPTDPPNSTFRIRLVTVLLKGCGDYFLEDEASRKKLKSFLKYLQRYLFFKKEDPVWQNGAFPYAYEPFHVVTDLISHLFPKMEMFKSYANACEEVEQMESRLIKRYKVKLPSPKPQPMRIDSHGLGNIQECDETSTGADGGGDRVDDEFYNAGSFWTQNVTGGDVSARMVQSGAEVKDVRSYNAVAGGGEMLDLNDQLGVETSKGNTVEVVSVEEDSEFERQLEKMLCDASQAAQRESRHVNTEIRIPMNLQKAKHSDSAEQRPSGTISYALLMKKGNKANVKHVNVPANMEFVKQRERREAVDREERAQLKQRTLHRLQLDEEME